MLNKFFHGFYAMVNILGLVLFIFNYFASRLFCLLGSHSLAPQYWF